MRKVLLKTYGFVSSFVFHELTNTTEKEREDRERERDREDKGWRKHHANFSAIQMNLSAILKIHFSNK